MYGENLVFATLYIKNKLVMDGFKNKKKKLMEFSIKGPDPASQHLNGKKKHGLKML